MSEQQTAAPVVSTAGTPLDGGHADRTAERVVASWFLLSAAGAVFFFVTYWVNAKPSLLVNALLGGSLAVALGAMGIGAIQWAKKLMPAEEAVQERHPFGSPPDLAVEAGETWNAGVAGSGIARRPLLRRSLLLAAGALGLPLIAPLRSLGPKPTAAALNHTRWFKGARMVLADGTPIALGDVALNGIATVFPEGHTDLDAAADSAVMLINIGVDNITDKTRPKAFAGYVAFSKICTHAGCPVGLYSQQTRILLCPCHQSQFDVPKGAKPVAGPATRSLPQLAITADSTGYLTALGDFDEPVGPGFWERG